jgi:hypothetical protein
LSAGKTEIIDFSRGVRWGVAHADACSVCDGSICKAMALSDVVRLDPGAAPPPDQRAMPRYVRRCLI